MAATIEDLAPKIANRLKGKIRGAFTWTETTEAVGQSSAGQRDTLVAAVQNGDQQALGAALLDMIQNYINSKANARALDMLEDGSLSLVELDEVLE
jgi:DNA-binding FadR family transcriptional regulator